MFSIWALDSYSAKSFAAIAEVNFVTSIPPGIPLVAAKPPAAVATVLASSGLPIGLANIAARSACFISKAAVISAYDFTAVYLARSPSALALAASKVNKFVNIFFNSGKALLVNIIPTTTSIAFILSLDSDKNEIIGIISLLILVSNS